MDCLKYRHAPSRGAFLLEAAVVLLLLMAAAAAIARFAAVTARARQQQWSQFQRENQLDNVVEQLRFAAADDWEATVDRLEHHDRYGRPSIAVEAINVEGVAGNHIVVTWEADDSSSKRRQTEFWQFDPPGTEEGLDAAAAAGGEDAS